jgi:hypothetical protein
MLKLWALAFGLTVATAAIAETPEERQACMDDAFKHCERAIPDQDRVFACLVHNHQLISALCRQALTAYLPAEPAAKQAKGKAPAPKSTGAAKGPLNLNPNAR